MCSNIHRFSRLSQISQSVAFYSRSRTCSHCQLSHATLSTEQFGTCEFWITVLSQCLLISFDMSMIPGALTWETYSFSHWTLSRLANFRPLLTMLTMLFEALTCGCICAVHLYTFIYSVSCEAQLALLTSTAQHQQSVYKACWSTILPRIIIGARDHSYHFGVQNKGVFLICKVKGP